VAATRRSALSAAAAILLFSLGCSTDEPSFTEAADANPPSTQNALDVSVSLAPEVRGAESVIAHVTVINRSTSTVDVPESQLPSEDLETQQFVVLRDGERVNYEGPHIKRGPSIGDAIISIAPGAAYSYDIELSRAYDLSRDGRYSVVFESRDSRAQTVLRSARQEVRLYGRAALATSGIADRTLSALTSQITYARCTTTQQTAVRAALAQAETYAINSRSYMAANNLADRYTWWFGAVTTANASRVLANFTAIADAFATKPIKVDCGCKKTYFAYVYANQPYTIYVCKAFWSAPLAGTDSRGGTLVHEMSHFTVVAGTGDFAYGQSAARNLALTNVSQAIANADNHEYFAENTPARQ
jgi:peptidyl-Lys metalloendopeptidase